MRAVPGPWDLYMRYFPDRGTPVFGSISVDRLRLCLLQILRKESVYANRCMEISKGFGCAFAEDL